MADKSRKKPEPGAKRPDLVKYWSELSSEERKAQSVGLPVEKENSVDGKHVEVWCIGF